jgi:hypothetical protein
LSVKPAIARPAVFVTTVDAEGKVRHRRFFPLERHRANDRVPRTTSSAAAERIAEAAIVRLVNFPSTVGTDRSIFRNAGCQRASGRFLDDQELIAATGRGRLGDQRRQAGGSRERSRQSSSELIQVSSITLKLDFDAPRRIANRSG